MKHLAFAFVLALAACGASAQQAELQHVQDTGDALRQKPGPRQAVAYAEAIRGAKQAGAFDKYPGEWKSRAEEAVASLEALTVKAGDDASLLIAWKALLLVDLGRHDAAWQAFEASMRVRPNALAARNMIIVWSTAGEPRKVGETCAQTVPYLGDAGDRYDFIEFCRSHTNAVTEDASLAWATAETRSFFESERARRREVQAAAEQERLQRERHEQFVVREMEVCSSRCKQRGHECLNRCGADQECRDNCVQANHACVDACSSEAYQSLGQ